MIDLSASSAFGALLILISVISIVAASATTRLLLRILVSQSSDRDLVRSRTGGFVAAVRGEVGRSAGAVPTHELAEGIAYNFRTKEAKPNARVSAELIDRI